MMHRRNLLTSLSALAIGTPALHRAIAVAVQDDGALTKETLANAQWICGLDLTEEEQAAILKDVQSNSNRLSC